MDLTNRHVLITGAGVRVARTIAERLLDWDIRLTCHYRHSRSQAEALVALARGRGRQAASVCADLTAVSQVASAVDAAVRRFGPVDVLINSAADFYPTPVLQTTESQWDALMDVNLKGQFFLIQAVGRHMKDRGGIILNLVDVNAEKPMRGYSPYVASKAGLLMLTKNLALEWAPKVRVNAISPGAVCLPENYTAEQTQRSIDRTLLKRLGTPQDIAEAAVFLIENDYITGFNLKVDGGRSIA